MRLLVLDDNYPHQDNILGDVFVHVRVKEYLKRHEVQVFSFFSSARTILYEGVQIRAFDSVDKLYKAVSDFKPDKLLIHFYQPWMLESLIKPLSIPVIIWVHGYEALGWYRRLFNYHWYSPVLLKYILKNTKQQVQFRKLIKYANNNLMKVQFIFVSDWMRQITEFDTASRVKNYEIISNPIDTELFSYTIKSAEQRKKILLLRSFHSRKYANDISVKAILHLSKKPFFKDLSFTLIGDGPLFGQTVAPLESFCNVDIQQRVVRQMMIPDIHKEHGIFLCPTRQDAQGVSMCEAMSSGLVPVTTNCTAIPEFVEDNVSGILSHSAAEVAKGIEALYDDADLFGTLSLNTAKSIREQCSLATITKKEFSIIES